MQTSRALVPKKIDPQVQATENLVAATKALNIVI